MLEYNKTCTVLKDEYYGIDEIVYIIAGDDPSYFERVRTGPDGTFWFPNLRMGKYEVYALSENCAFGEVSVTHPPQRKAPKH